MPIRVKRVYDPPAPDDGWRVLVDRLWPRGLTREAAALDLWAKDLAPSDALRRWFAEGEDRHAGFAERYRAELADPDRAAQLDDLRRRAATGTVTLLYAKRDRTHNNAEVLAEVLRAVSDPGSTG